MLHQGILVPKVWPKCTNGKDDFSWKPPRLHDHFQLPGDRQTKKGCKTTQNYSFLRGRVKRLETAMVPPLKDLFAQGASSNIVLQGLTSHR